MRKEGCTPIPQRVPAHLGSGSRRRLARLADPADLIAKQRRGLSVSGNRAAALAIFRSSSPRLRGDRPTFTNPAGRQPPYGLADVETTKSRSLELALDAPTTRATRRHTTSRTTAHALRPRPLHRQELRKRPQPASTLMPLRNTRRPDRRSPRYCYPPTGATRSSAPTWLICNSITALMVTGTLQSAGAGVSEGTISGQFWTGCGHWLGDRRALRSAIWPCCAGSIGLP
jgi:hypothetical protein